MNDKFFRGPSHYPAQREQVITRIIPTIRATIEAARQRKEK